MRSNIKVVIKVLLTYILVGPPIGGLVMFVIPPVMIFVDQGDFGDWLSLKMAYVFLAFSYVFGIIPALACGSYAVICTLRKRAVNYVLYYTLAAIISSLNFIWFFDSDEISIERVVFPSLSAIIAATCTLRFTRPWRWRAPTSAQLP